MCSPLRIILAILFSLLLTVQGEGQNWVLLDENTHYFYQKDGEFSGDVFSVRVDSISEVGLFLNKTIIPDLDLLANQLNYPSFFADWISVEESGRKWILHRGNEQVLYPQAALGMSWVYNELNGVEAEILAIEEEEIWGEVDSVKTILLSTGDRIKLSKRFGILVFPVEHNTFRQLGIKVFGESFGETLIGFDEIFNFEIGDQFERLYGNIYGPGFHEYQRERIEITEKEQGNDYFTYSIRGVLLDFYDTGDQHSTVDTFYIDTIRNYNRNEYRFLEHGSYEAVKINNSSFSYGVISFSNASSLCVDSNIKIKKNPDPYWQFFHAPSVTAPDSLVCIFPCQQSQPPGHKYQTYAKGLGLTQDGSTYTAMTNELLIAATTTEIHCDFFNISDELFYSDPVSTDEVNDNPLNVQYYPNPVQKSLTVKIGGNGQFRVCIYDGVGTLISSQNVFGGKEKILSTHQLMPGYYRIIIMNSGGQYMKNGSFIKV